MKKLVLAISLVSICMSSASLYLSSQQTQLVNNNNPCEEHSLNSEWFDLQTGKAVPTPKGYTVCE